MAAIPHNHELDGKLYEACPACSYIKLKTARTKANKEVDQDLKAIYERGLLGQTMKRLRRPSTKRRKD